MAVTVNVKEVVCDGKKNRKISQSKKTPFDQKVEVMQDSTGSSRALDDQEQGSDDERMSNKRRFFDGEVGVYCILGFLFMGLSVVFDSVVKSPLVAFSFTDFSLYIFPFWVDCDCARRLHCLLCWSFFLFLFCLWFLLIARVLLWEKNFVWISEF